jgi:hypothetical protein
VRVARNLALVLDILRALPRVRNGTRTAVYFINVTIFSETECSYVYYCSVDTILYRCTIRFALLLHVSAYCGKSHTNHSCRHQTLSTQGQATGIQKHTAHTCRPNTKPEHQYNIIEKSHNNKRTQAAAALVNSTRRLTARYTRGREHRKEINIYICLWIPNSVQCNLIITL